MSLTADAVEYRSGTEDAVPLTTDAGTAGPTSPETHR